VRFAAAAVPGPASCWLRPPPCLPFAVYKVVVTKEAKRLELHKDEPHFGDVLKQQWDDKQQELQQDSGKE